MEPSRVNWTRPPKREPVSIMEMRTTGPSEGSYTQRKPHPFQVSKSSCPRCSNLNSFDPGSIPENGKPRAIHVETWSWPRGGGCVWKSHVLTHAVLEMDFSWLSWSQPLAQTVSGVF